MTFDEARALFPVLERFAYLNAGTCGPLSRGTAEAMAEEERRELESGRSGLEYVERALAIRAEARAVVGALVGADPSAVAVTASTTDGCNIVLAGLGVTPGDEVITTTDEHFALLGPLHASGARVVVAPPDPDAILAAVTPRTRLLALSQVLWTTGEILPVRELRERSGRPILVDGAQSVGAVPVDAAGFDFLTISGQKWLCGPNGAGALVVAEPERLRIARPSYFAQSSYEQDGTFEPREGAVRFEPNWTAVPTLVGWLAAMRQVPEWAHARAFELAERLRGMLAGCVEVLTPQERATLVSFRPPPGDEAAAVVARLADAGVVVRDLPGRELVRASVGWWTSEDDLDRLVSALG